MHEALDSSSSLAIQAEWAQGPAAHSSPALVWAGEVRAGRVNMTLGWSPSLVPLKARIFLFSNYLHPLLARPLRAVAVVGWEGSGWVNTLFHPALDMTQGCTSFSPHPSFSSLLLPSFPPSLHSLMRFKALIFLRVVGFRESKYQRHVPR